MNENTEITQELEQLSVSSSYQCSPEQCNTYLDNVVNGFNIFHLNIRSIGNSTNFNNLLILLNRIKVHFDAIVLSECWLRKCPYLPTIPGFEAFQSNHANQNDGIVVYVRQNLQVTVEIPIFTDANCLILKFGTEIALVAIYRSPSFRNTNDFIDCLDLTMHSLMSFKTIILIGDININISQNANDINSDTYLNTVASHAMLPAHLFPTRNNACLDHAVIKSNKPAITLVLDSTITDHAPVIVFCKLTFDVTKTLSSSRRVDVDACVAVLQTIDFTSVMNCDDATTAATCFVNIVSTVVNNNSVTRTIPSKKRIIKPWITPGLLRCIRNRDNLSLQSKGDPNNSILQVTFKRYRNFCNNLLKKIKREYERTEFEKHRRNPKATWNLIKSISNLQNNKSTAIELLSITPDPSDSVDNVNDFFANVGKKLASKITNKHCTRSSDNNSCPNSMAILSPDCEEIERIILGLRANCAVGWDGISAVLIRAARHTLIPIISHIFNLALTSGVFPAVFKRALVHPIYKSGDRGSVNNYRPISVLTILSKILEKIINSRLLNYLNSQNIISENQYGFRTGRSTEDAVLEVTGIIAKNIKNKLKTLAIFLDLSKAFDTVSVPLLLEKLERVGVRGVCLDIFRSYLSERSQTVKLGNHVSKQKYLTYGVPQGSVLGPTLFLIYINDLCNLALTSTKIITYADDTVMLIHGKDWLETRSHAESALLDAMKWLNKNLLTLNVEKTKFITFAPSKASQPLSPYTLTAHKCGLISNDCRGCAQVTRTHSIKYLGVIIDSTLTWKEQIEALVARVRKLIFVFKNLRTSADFATLRTVYFALAHSILKYCIAAWGGAGKCLMLRLERAQRAVLKVMTHKPVRFPTTELYALCDLPSVRHAFLLAVVLRKHSELPFDPVIFSQKRRSDRVCQVESATVQVVRRQYRFCSSTLYNRVNKQLNIYPLTLRECRGITDKWLHTLTYEELEKFVKI